MNKHKDHILDVHINPNVKELKPSATVAINDLSNELKRSGRDIFKLGLGQWRLGTGHSKYLNTNDLIHFIA